MPDTKTHAQRRKAESVEAIRERLRQYGHHDQAIEILEKLQDVRGVDLEQLDVTRLSKALDGHIRIMNHYMPKVQEVVAPPGSGKINIEYVVPDANNANTATA